MSLSPKSDSPVKPVEPRFLAAPTYTRVLHELVRGRVRVVTQVMIEIDPNVAVNLEAARELGLVSRAYDAELRRAA